MSKKQFNTKTASLRLGYKYKVARWYFLEDLKKNPPKDAVLDLAKVRTCKRADDPFLGYGVIRLLFVDLPHLVVPTDSDGDLLSYFQLLGAQCDYSEHIGFLPQLIREIGVPSKYLGEEVPANRPKFYSWLGVAMPATPAYYRGEDSSVFHGVWRSDTRYNAPLERAFEDAGIVLSA